MWRAHKSSRLRTVAIPESGNSKENRSVWTVESEMPVAVQWALRKQTPKLYVLGKHSTTTLDPLTFTEYS